MADPKPLNVVLGADAPKAPPYATSAFASVQGGLDVTIVFMRTPVLGPEELKKALAAGQVEGVPVAAVTLPLGAARRVGELLLQVVPEEAGGNGSKEGT